MAAGGRASFLSSGTDTVFDFFCQLCIDDNKQVEAEGYCANCCEYLCGSCYSGHNKSRLTRNHVLQDKSNMPKDSPISTEKVSKKITTTNPICIIANKRASIEVSSSSDWKWGYCIITGSAVVSPNRLIIADKNNSKVKLIDTDKNQLLGELKVSSQPHDITIFNSSEAAVTLPNNSKILVMKVSPSLVKDRKIHVSGRCRGIAYSQSKLLVTFTDNPRLEIIDLHGKVLRTIENDSYGRELFTCPYYVCVSRDGENIYVSDKDCDTVVSLTRNGELKALYKDKELKKARKLCTDSEGNVYVCGNGSTNVHIITPDCKKIKVILTQADGLNSYVKSVSYCQDTNRLFLGFWGNTVQVYQMSY